jgi:hypothetical protein
MMLLPRAVKVYVATAPCNLRKSFDGLSNEVREALAKRVELALRGVARVDQRIGLDDRVGLRCGARTQPRGPR